MLLRPLALQPYSTPYSRMIGVLAEAWMRRSYRHASRRQNSRIGPAGTRSASSRHSSTRSLSARISNSPATRASSGQSASAGDATDRVGDRITSFSQMQQHRLTRRDVKSRPQKTPRAPGVPRRAAGEQAALIRINAYPAIDLYDFERSPTIANDRQPPSGPLIIRDRSGSHPIVRDPSRSPAPLPELATVHRARRVQWCMGSHFRRSLDGTRVEHRRQLDGPEKAGYREDHPKDRGSRQRKGRE
jgi:hypothetical protein